MGAGEMPLEAQALAGAGQDGALVASCRSGDPAAFARLVAAPRGDGLQPVRPPARRPRGGPGRGPGGVPAGVPHARPVRGPQQPQDLDLPHRGEPVPQPAALLAPPAPGPGGGARRGPPRRAGVGRARGREREPVRGGAPAGAGPAGPGGPPAAELRAPLGARPARGGGPDVRGGGRRARGARGDGEEPPVPGARGDAPAAPGARRGRGERHDVRTRSTPAVGVARRRARARGGPRGLVAPLAVRGLRAPGRRAARASRAFSPSCRGSRPASRWRPGSSTASRWRPRRAGPPWPCSSAASRPRGRSCSRASCPRRSSW